MTHYLTYWKPSTVDLDKRDPTLAHTASNQFGRVAVGDTLWIVSSEEPDDLVLVGRLKVDRIVGQAEAERILGPNLWEAEYHTICDEPEDKIILNISRWARELGFDGVVDRLPEGFTGQHLQSMRRLDFDSANLLERLWTQRNEAE